MRTIPVLIASAAILLAAPANAHFPAKCGDALNFFSVDGQEAQKWKSKNVSSKTKAFLATPDLIRLKSWAVDVDANQQYLAQTMLPALKDLMKCIAANAGAPAASASVLPASKHEIPVCGTEMARANFEARFCPSPWTEIWSTDFVGTYRRVWHCADSNSQFGSFLNAKGCGSAWLPKGYSRVK